MANKSDRHSATMLLMSALMSRFDLAQKFGLQYGGSRDVFTALGYPKALRFEDYAIRYRRQDIAAAIIDRPVESTWRDGFEVIESEEAEDTLFELQWAEMYNRFGLNSIFQRLDRLSCVGEFGILLLGIDDVKSNEDFSKPANIGRSKFNGSSNGSLLYLKPLSQGSVSIQSVDLNPNSQRFGYPELYSVMLDGSSSSLTSFAGSTSLLVHHSRVLHVVMGTVLESELFCAPILEKTFNRLIDLEKLVGGSAEMFWKGARPGYVGKVDPEFQLTEKVREELREQLDEFEHNLRRFLINEGIDIESLASQISDPSSHVDVQIQMISAATGIPKRILTGSERGELASTQDLTSWNSVIVSRRKLVEQRIIRPFVDRMIELSILPEPETGDYTISWPDLWAQSEEEQARVGQIRTQALAAYAAEPMASSIVPEEAFLEFFLGLSREEIDYILTLKEEEKKSSDVEDKLVEENPGGDVEEGGGNEKIQ